MDNRFLVSPVHFAGGTLPRRSVADGQTLHSNDPAIHAMTDFSREHPATVDAERQIDDALNDMIRLGVRALLVYKEDRIIGLVTSYDIQGERPMQFLQASNYTQHRDIRVADVMTPWENLMAVDWDEVQSACAGDLLQVFQETGLTHLIVVEHDRHTATATVRAMVSRTRLSRQLGDQRRPGDA